MREAHAADEAQFIRDLARHGQRPVAFFLGCSDSRIIPEQLVNAVPGELFVVRNVANLLTAASEVAISAGAALEYAVGHLHVRHLIVCGHDLCGGVRAALDGTIDPGTEPALAAWLSGLEPAVARTRGIADAHGSRWRRTVEENVIVQLENSLAFDVVASRVAVGDLALHGWVYDLVTATLRVLDARTGAFVAAGDLVAEQ